MLWFRFGYALVIVWFRFGFFESVNKCFIVDNEDGSNLGEMGAPGNMGIMAIVAATGDTGRGRYV